MAGETALDKVLTALRATLAAAIPTVTWQIDRPEDDALGRGELPHGNIQHSGTRFEQLTHGETLHRATIDISMTVETKAASTNARRLREMEADIVAAIAAAPTLGGLAQDIIPLSSGGDEDVRADEGASTLSLVILFLTPLGDHRTVLGAAGLIP